MNQHLTAETTDKTKTFDQIRNELAVFVTRNFNVETNDINMDESLIDQGIIDSFGLTEITVFIEQKFGLKIGEQDMTREAFGSMNKMANFIATRTLREE
jgi:acyl carrier protein